MNKSLISAIAWTGLLAGTLDILAACGNFSIQTGRDPIIVLRFIASGTVGPDAMTGGWPMAILGLTLHFLIAYSWTIIFFLIYPKLPKGNWIVYGLSYGIVVWLIMNLIVLPLSKIPQQPFNLKPVILSVTILMLMIGLPISYQAKKFYSR